MSMQLLEALTILTAGNSGEINYHTNDESFAIFQEARSVVGATATHLMDAQISRPLVLSTSGKATATWGDAFRAPAESPWSEIYSRDLARCRP